MQHPSTLIVTRTSSGSQLQLSERYAKVNNLDLLESPERFSSEQHPKVAAVKRWLEYEDVAEPRSWLLIFDNAKEGTVSALRDVLPKRNPNGNVLSLRVKLLPVP